MNIHAELQEEMLILDKYW